jgi:hypothetical protein
MFIITCCTHQKIINTLQTPRIAAGVGVVFDRCAVDRCVTLDGDFSVPLLLHLLHLAVISATSRFNLRIIAVDARSLLAINLTQFLVFIQVTC